MEGNGPESFRPDFVIRDMERCFKLESFEKPLSEISPLKRFSDKSDRREKMRSRYVELICFVLFEHLS
jgi:hypothetical protein